MSFSGCQFHASMVVNVASRLLQSLVEVHGITL